MTRIRKATLEDVRSLAEVHVASWQSAYRDILHDSVRKDFTVDMWVSKFEQMLAEDAQVIALIEDKGQMLGYTILGPNRDEDLKAELFRRVSALPKEVLRVNNSQLLEIWPELAW